MPDLKQMISGSQSLAHPSVPDLNSSHVLAARGRDFAAAAEEHMALFLANEGGHHSSESLACREFAVMYAQLAQAQRALEVNA